MYSISRKKVIKKKWKYQDFDQIKNLDGFLMPSRGNKFRIHEMVVKDILVVDVMLAKGLVRDYVDKKYKKLIAELTELLISDDDTGEPFRIALNRIEKFRQEVKNKYRIYLEKKELEIMAKQLSTLQKQAKLEFAELQNSLMITNEIGKGR
mgnify:FL=1